MNEKNAPLSANFSGATGPSAPPLDSLENLNEAYWGVNGLEYPENPRRLEDSEGSKGLVAGSVPDAPPTTDQPLPDHVRCLGDEARRSQDAFPQLKRQPGQLIERPSDAYCGLNRIGPTEAKLS